MEQGETRWSRIEQDERELKRVEENGAKWSKMEQEE